MKFLVLLLSSWAAADLAQQPRSKISQALAYNRGTGFRTDALAASALERVVSDVQKRGYLAKGCTLDDVYVRREWSDLSKQERRDYIQAVHCLYKLPSKSDPKLVPGARNRFDDFVGIHINRTMSIHVTGNFLHWHRLFTFAYEQTLRNECGYKGYQPYVNWGKYANDPLKGAVFDGSETSMSGNGRYRAHGDIFIPRAAQPEVVIPPSSGGDCIYSGPFVNWTVNLGPFGPPQYPYVKPNPREDGLGYNPRCIRRDISQYVSSTWTKDSDSHSVITSFDTISGFQGRMDGDFPNHQLGVHSGGHYTILGDPGADFFASPGDPYFYLHHGMMDRMWWIWQNQDPAKRTFVVGDTMTFNNTPPSREARLDDMLDLGFLAPPITLRQASSTMGASPFCYIYA